MYIATITATRAWITLAEDPDGTAIICGTRQTSPIDSGLDGEVVYYAGGRSQPAVYDQDLTTAHYTLAHLSPDQLLQIRSWRGKVVLLRTVEGERLFGTYFAAPYSRDLFTTPEDDSAEVTFDVDIELQQVSYNEEV